VVVAARAADLLVRLGGSASPLPDVARPAAVIASPMTRTRQTAAAAARRLRLDVEVDEGWIEAGFGAWEGLTYAEIARRYPEELGRWQGSTTVAPPEGESLDAVVERVRAARARAVRSWPGRVVVIATHATPARVVVQEALDAGPAALWRLRISPAGLTVVRCWSDGGVEVLAVNATAHLTGG
jgi:probable phosphoglycerate mutase